MSNGGKTRWGYFLNFVRLYIDPLLLELKRSGIGCNINGTYMGVLSYADDITLSCPSTTWGLNHMLKMCERFPIENICIKF